MLLNKFILDFPAETARVIPLFDLQRCSMKTLLLAVSPKLIYLRVSCQLRKTR